MIRNVLAVALAAAALAIGGLGIAQAVAAIPPGTVHGCVYPSHNRSLERVYTNPARGTTCPAGTSQVIWSKQGPAGRKARPVRRAAHCKRRSSASPARKSSAQARQMTSRSPAPPAGRC